jgi:hypothetical protein
MVFNATFNNISVISWWSVLLVEESGVPGENHQPAASQWQTLSHNVVAKCQSFDFCCKAYNYYIQRVLLMSLFKQTHSSDSIGGLRGRDRMVVGIINTYAINAYHH